MIIGIGGASNSGKSALALKIGALLPSANIAILCQDGYVFPEDSLPRVRDHIDWENPESIDFLKFRSHIISSHTELDFLIAEGLLCFYDPEINDLFDKRIFIEISKKTFLERKNNDLRWGREPEWYVRHIWQSFLKFGQPRTNEVMVVDGNTDYDLTAVLKYILS